MGTKRARFGSIRQLASGRWQARYTGSDSQRYKAPDTFDTEQAAEQYLSKVDQLIRLEAWTPPAVEPVRKLPTVGDVVEQWLSQCEKQVATGELRITSLQTYENIMNKRVLNYESLCSIRVDELSARDVGHWWALMNTEHPGTVNRNKRAYSKLRTAMSLAVEYGWISRNPVEIRAARKRPPGKRKNLATTEQLHSILNETPERYKLVTVLCLFHGFRVGEALAVKRRNIETTPDGGYRVKVEGTLQRVVIDGHTRMRWHPPKTQAGYRTVPVFPEFHRIISRHLELFPGNSGDYATTTVKGASVMDTSYRSVFNGAKDRAGAPDEITPHYGRNWLITRLAEAGATPKEIGAILGQEDVSTIVNVYMRVREHRPAELMQRIKPLD